MLSIRRASEADCALIRRLAGEVFPATYREILAPAQLDYMMEWMYSEESLQGQFRAGHVWFIASSDGEPCGYVSVERQGEDLFLLQKIYVLPRFQGLGAGEFLFRRAVEYIRSVHSGPCMMELNVNRRNRALHFYERMGIDRDGSVRRQILDTMHLPGNVPLPVFIVGDTFNRVVFESHGYTIGLGDRFLHTIHQL